MVKYEEAIFNAYETVDEARGRLASYFVFYNTERLPFIARLSDAPGGLFRWIG